MNEISQSLITPQEAFKKSLENKKNIKHDDRIADFVRQLFGDGYDQEQVIKEIVRFYHVSKGWAENFISANRWTAK